MAGGASPASRDPLADSGPSWQPSAGLALPPNAGEYRCCSFFKLTHYPQSVALDPAPEGRVVRLQAARAEPRNGSDECLLHDFSKLTPTSTTVATRLKCRAFDTFQSLTGLVVSRKYLRVGEEKARGRQPARRAAAPQPPAAGVADQPVSQTAVCDTRARAPSGQRRRVSYPMSDSMSCIRRARVPVRCAARAMRIARTDGLGDRFTGQPVTPSLATQTALLRSRRIWMARPRLLCVAAQSRGTRSRVRSLSASV